MPVTHITFLIACLAIAGFPLLSGFFSKDEILTACFAYSPIMGWVMTGIAGLTAFYMFRLYFNIFWGGDTPKQDSHAVPHESPANMLFPLIFLALVTCGAGFIPFGKFISSNGQAYSIHLNPTVAITSVTVALLAIGFAMWMYMRPSRTVAEKLGKTFPGLYKAAYNRFYIDSVYMFITHKIIFKCISTPIAWFDRNVVDGFFNMLASGTQAVSQSIKGFQSGRVQQYAIMFLCGVIALILLLVF